MGKMSDLTIPDVDPIEMAIDKIFAEHPYSQLKTQLRILAHEIDSQAEFRGMNSVIRIRCTRHHDIRTYNTKASGCECGACVFNIGFRQGKIDAY